MSRRQSLELRARLARGSFPLAIAIGVVIAVSAPTAYYVFGARDAQNRASNVADSLAEALGHDGASEPELWRYNSAKVLRHVREFQLGERGDSVAQAVVLDQLGTPVESGAIRDSTLHWASAEIRAGEARLGTVWVAVSVGRLRRNASLLALGFAALALLLAGLMYVLPLRIVRAAEGEIRSLVGALESAQEDLEGQVAARVVELESAYAELERRDQRLRELSSRSAALQEEERRAISRDLHDSAGQSLTAIRINMQLLAQVSAAGQTAELARSTMELADGALEEVRRALASLSPSILGDLGLVGALQRMCDDAGERGQLDLHFTSEVPAADIAALAPAVETACYRIAQEAITNVLRHAGASAASVTLRREREQLHLCIEDDGRGLDTSSQQSRSEGGGRGLANMRERVELLGGEFSATSLPAGGCRVCATLPL